MLIYVFVIAFSVLMAFFAQKLYERSRMLGLVASALCVLPLATVSGLRDITVGYDFMFYCYNDFRHAIFSPSYSYCMSHTMQEAGYMTIIYFVSTLTHDPHWLMFALTLVTMSFAWMACLRLNDRVPATFILVMSYVDSFNFIRQSLAVTTVTFAYSCYRGKNGGLLFWLVAALAFSFHHSSILAILVIFFAQRLSKTGEKTQKRMLFLYLVGMAAGIVALAIVIQALADRFPFFEKYVTYADGKGHEGWRESGVSKLAILQMMIGFAVVMLTQWLRSYDKSTRTIALVMLATNTGALLLGTYTAAAARLSLYFAPLCFFFILFSSQEARRLSAGSKAFFALVVLSTLAFSFVKNYSSPLQFLWYKSQILGL